MRSVACPLFVHSREIPNQEALIWGRRAMTWEQLHAYVHSTARYLKEIGVAHGTRVAIWAPNSIEYVITLLSLWRIGACVMPLDVQLPPPVLTSVLQDSQAGFLFFSDELPQLKMPGLKVCRMSMLISYTFSDGFLGREEHLSPSIDLEADAAVVLASGSGGLPKGVLLSYENLLVNASGANELISFCPPDRWLLSLPLWHVSGLAIIFRALSGGGAVAVPDAAEPLAEAVLRYRPTHLSLVPGQLKRLLPAEGKVWSSLKAVLLDGAPIPTGLAREAVAAGVPLYGTYGLTETASQVATGPAGPDGVVEARPLRDRAVKISPEGEVLVRGAVLFRRYVFGGAQQAFDAEGWYPTGDRGYLDPAGRLHINGRMDNMFICGGEKI